MANADQSDAPAVNQLLPEPLPTEPLSLFRGWFDEAHARKVQPNPNAMSLATIDEDGSPAVRMVLCKDMKLSGVPNHGAEYLVFFTNYMGRKGRSLFANPRAAVCFHWDALDRQVRIEGPVTQSPVTEGDAYFASRPLVSRVSAWASDQSRPVGSRQALVDKLSAVAGGFGVDLDKDGDLRGTSGAGGNVPRPPHWGGFRLWARRVELWVGGVGRLHDRAEWTRTLAPTSIDGAEGFRVTSEWASTRVQP